MDLSGNKIQILAFNKNIIRIYNLTTDKQYYIKIKFAYDLGIGEINPVEVEYKWLIGRNLYICDHHYFFCRWVIPSGAYSLICLKKDVTEIECKCEYTLEEIYKYWENDDISINRIKEILDLSLLETRWLIKKWEIEKRVYEKLE